ncbi:MAG TPA: LuxR C-terminal-related transcriptional regulator [Chthoniobacterales bacterium]|jgi:hypothetical protein|nr:LuxR C-terminal-related transcriptional regulator [Chthoniobacterales bacterium]
MGLPLREMRTTRVQSVIGNIDFDLKILTTNNKIFGVFLSHKKLSVSQANPLCAVWRVLAGKIYLSVEMTPSLLKGFIATGSRNLSNPIERLSDRELQILSLIARGRSTRDIAELLNLGIAMVDTYRARI